MFLQEYYDVFVEYIERSIMVDDYSFNSPSSAKSNSFPVDDFLESLDVNVLRVLATIKKTGHHTGCTFIEFDAVHVAYQHYEDELRALAGFEDSKEFYIECINSLLWGEGHAYVFQQGLERLEIILENVPSSIEIYEYDDIGYYPSEISYVEFREMLCRLTCSDFHFFDDSKSNEMAQLTMLNGIFMLIEKMNFSFMDVFNIWNNFWFNKPDVELSVTDTDVIEYLEDIYMEYTYSTCMRHDYALSKILSDSKMDIANVNNKLKKFDMEYSLGITKVTDLDFDFVLSADLTSTAVTILFLRMKKSISNFPLCSKQ